MRALSGVPKLQRELAYDPGDDVNVAAQIRTQVDTEATLARDATLEHQQRLTDAARSLLFFKVVRSNPKAVKRCKVLGELGFASGDVVVAPHKLCTVDLLHKHMIVEATALQAQSGIAGNSVPAPSALMPLVLL